MAEEKSSHSWVQFGHIVDRFGHAKDKRLNMLEKLIESGARLDSQDAEGRTALYWAATEGF